jgi:hypothetical protein
MEPHRHHLIDEDSYDFLVERAPKDIDAPLYSPVITAHHALHKSSIIFLLLFLFLPTT